MSKGKGTNLTLKEIEQVLDENALWIECACGQRLPVYANTNLKPPNRARCLRCDDCTEYTLKFQAVLRRYEGIFQVEWRQAQADKYRI